MSASSPGKPGFAAPKFLDTLDALSRIDAAIFTNWQLLVRPDIDFLLEVEEQSGAAAASEKVETYSPEAARPRIAAIVEENVTRGDLREPLPRRGYSMIAYKADGPTSRRISLSIKAGGKVSGYAVGDGRLQNIGRPGAGDLSVVQGCAARDQCWLASCLGLRLRLQAGL